ncbi:MarR family transcriptional regulator [Fictibacillus macauensis ZFHKF-1]|uniref:MarR family transcriptional regulator n=1 Tax=Fictibacillus macauensis ZFHKF-1 TaxID=1196324 RepID=I8UIG6_9BACL|nr:MarR family transcriptional regulator [Fictibacillus macauensis]EIT86685.1 MarR family transcriptional regulator [Fictibacillus macauensis ZFHKF-1]
MDLYKELFLMQQTYGTLFSLANKIQIKGDKYLELLTSRQYMAMVAIAHLPEEETTLNNIARKLGTTKQSAKQLVTIIENKGYIKVVPSSKDKRAMNVKITELGEKVLLVVAEKGIYFLEDLFKAFSTEELETMWELLKKLYRFDGEKQDGFEEEGRLNTQEEHDALQQNVMKEFERRRIEARDHKNNV